MSTSTSRPGGPPPTPVELEAALPPAFARVHLEVQGGAEWVSVRWTSAAERGVIAGPARDVALALAATVLRLVGVETAVAKDQDVTGPHRFPRR